MFVIANKFKMKNCFIWHQADIVGAAHDIVAHHDRRCNQFTGFFKLIYNLKNEPQSIDGLILLPTLTAEQVLGKVGPDNLVLASVSYHTVSNHKKPYLSTNAVFFLLTLSPLHFNHCLSCSTLYQRILKWSFQDVIIFQRHVLQMLPFCFVTFGQQWCQLQSVSW